MNPPETESADLDESIHAQLPTQPSCAIDFSFADELLSPEDELPHRQFSSSSQHQIDGGGMYSSASIANRSLENILLDVVSMDESIDLGSGADLAGKVNVEGEDDFETQNNECDDPGKNQKFDKISDVPINISSSDAEISENQSCLENLSLSSQARALEMSMNDEMESKNFQLNACQKENLSTETPELHKGQLDVGRNPNPSLSVEHVDILDDGTERHESFSLSPKVIVNEAVEVDFSTGLKPDPSGLTPADSSKSLIKFFTAGGAETGGTDVDGKNFFDSFSTGNEEQEQALGSAVPLSTSPSVSVTDGPGQHYWCPVPVGGTTTGIPTAGISSTVFPNSVVPQDVQTKDSESTVKSFSQSHPDPSIQPMQASHVDYPSEVSRSQSSTVDQISIQFHEPQLEVSWGAVSSMVSRDAEGVSAESAIIENTSHDAWIPSEATARVLASVMAGTPVTSLTMHLSCPGIVLQDLLGDPVYDLVLRCVGEQEANKRLVRNADSVPQDDVGLRQLIISDCLRSAVDLSGRLLSQCGQGPGMISQESRHTPYSLQLWFTRLALMVKLRLFTQAESEFEPFGNLETADLFYELHQESFPRRRGSMVPFEMRVLHAELPQFLGRSQEALDRLYHLESVTNKILSNLSAGLAEDGGAVTGDSSSFHVASSELWRSRHVRILYSIGNCLLGIKDYGSAVQIYRQLLDEDTGNKSHLYNGLGRINLQMGDIASASKFFEISEGLSDPATTAAKCQSLMNRGFVALGNNQFSEAHRLFKEIVDLDNNNVMAVNNMAVCSLYLGRLKGALEALETLVYSDPRRHLQESIVLNLCTLYELESSKAALKKNRLLGLISQHKGNAFNVACLKMA